MISMVLREPTNRKKPVFRVESRNIRRVLQRRVRKGISKLRGLEIGDELGVEILSRLVDGRWTASEIVELVYGLGNGEEGYKSCHGKISRELRKLESKGLVSRSPFGREKPYRLTELAVINLARIGGEHDQLPVIPRIDLAAYSVTGALSVLEASQAMGWLHLSESGTIGLLVALSFCLGISFVEVLRTIRRVF